MKKKNLWAILATVIMALPLFVGFGGTSANAAGDTATITIHKKKMLDLPDYIQNTGVEMEDFNSYEPLPDVEFKIYDVTEAYYTEYAKSGDQAAAIQAAKDATLGENVGRDTTDANGDLSFENLPKKSGEHDAVYLIVETTKDGVTAGDSKMVVAFPVYKMGKDETGNYTYTDDELDVIHLYPKNEVATDGSLVVTKTGTANNEPLNDAEFIVKRTVAGVTQYLKGAENGIFTWSENETDAYKFYTGKTYTIDDTGIKEDGGTKGKLNIVGFEYGDYILTETNAPTGAGLIKDDYPFAISSEVKNETLDIKNDTSKVEKSIPEVDGNQYAIGEAIDYEISTNIPEGIARPGYYTKFELSDKHDSALSFVGGSGVLVVRNGDSETTIDPSHYTIKPSANGFTVIVNPDYIASLPAGQELVFKYQMKLNETANPDKGYKNNASVDNGHSSDTTDEPVIVKTGGKRFVKVDADASNKTLAGATFVVARENKDGVKEYLVDPSKDSWSSKIDDAKEYTTEADGIVDVTGLKYGSYILVETVAPDGYVLPDDAETAFEVTEGSYGSGKTLVAPAKVPNKHKGSLPSTGGTGIIAFVAIGVVAVAGAVLYFTKGRRQIEG